MRFDTLVELVRGVAAAVSDLVVQLNRYVAAFSGGRDPVAGLRGFGAYLEALAGRYDIGVFCNVDHVTPG